MTTPGYTEVFISALLVLIAIAIARYWKIPVTRDMALGSVRAFAQLVAVGYALEFIFDMESLLMVLFTLLVMTAVGAQAAAARIKNVKRSYLIAFSSIFVGSAITIATMLISGVISFEARYIIPLGGMIIGNAMNSAALAIERLSSDIRNNSLAIETSLALGKSWREASSKFIREAATTGMISMLNFMKTVGIVALPGTMTGMILAGASPLEAVLLQIIVAYMLLVAVTLTSVVAVELAVRTFFTRFHQLRQELR